MTQSLAAHPAGWVNTPSDTLAATVAGTASTIQIRTDGVKYRIVRASDGMELQGNLADQTTATARANQMVSEGLI